MRSRTTIGLAVLLALPSCAPESEAPVSPPAPPSPPSPLSPAIDEPEDDRVAIEGLLRAHDGAALPQASVLVRRVGFLEETARTTLDDEGRFSVHVPPGMYSIVIEAVDHQRVVHRTLVTRDMRVQGRLGPSAGDTPGEPAQLEWTGGERESTAVLSRFRTRWSETLAELERQIPRTDGRLLDLTEALLAEGKALAGKAKAEVDATADPTTNAMLHLIYARMFSLYLGMREDGELARDAIDGVVEHVPPTMLELAMLDELSWLYSVAQEGADEAFVARSEAWLERCAREHSDPAMAVSTLTLLLAAAEQRGDEARVAALYALALDERYQVTAELVPLQRRYAPDRVLMRGKQFPAFDFAALDDEGRRITSDDRRGRVYLLEFWSKWCAPCVREMPKIHATYAAINGAKRSKPRSEASLRRLAPVERPKLEFVFISLGVDPAEIQAFRNEHWSMPFTHGFVSHADEEEVMARYGFSGIPMAVLIDETGTILELGEALRREALLPTLERVLAERRDPS